MAVKIQPQVRRPPDPLIREFIGPMRKLLTAWGAIAARAGDLEITSWYRPPTYNESVGGQPYSQHTVGCAMDAVSPRLGKAGLLQLAQSLASRYGVTVIGSEGRAVHLQALPAGFVKTWAQRNPTTYGTASAFVGPPRPIA